jgi:hypothetical protein
MTSGQRKAHKYIWLLIAIGIPILILFSIKDLDVFSSNNMSSSEIKATKSNVIKVAENDLIKVSLIKIDSTNSIEVILKSTLKNASSLVYELQKNNKKGKLIGQLTTVGIYNFQIKQSLKGIVVYDALKETLISKIEF